MSFLNIIKYFIIKNKKNKQKIIKSKNNIYDNFNYKLINNDNVFLNKKKIYENNVLQKNILPNKYFHPNQIYKQNQLNNIELLYKNNYIIYPKKTNLNDKYNYYLNNKNQYFKKNKNIINTNLLQIPFNYNEIYYNKNIIKNYSQLINKNFFSNKIKNHSLNNNYNNYLLFKKNQTQYNNSNFIDYKNYYNNYINYHKIYKNNYNKENIQQKCFNNKKNIKNLIKPYYSFFKKYNPISFKKNKKIIKNNTENKNYIYKQELSKKKYNSIFNKYFSNRLIPLEISREINSEKIRTLIMIVISLIGIITTSLFISIYFISHKQKLETIMNIKTKYIIHPFLTIIFLLIFIGLFFIGIFDLSKVYTQTNNYIYNLLLGNHIIPHFLIDNYKKMIIRNIILNWLFFTIYFFGGITLGILYWFKQYSGKEFFLGFWSLGIISDLNSTITIMIIILLIIFSFHIINIILTKKRKTNIIGYYGYEIINSEELKFLKKKTNHICFIVFFILIIILTLIISIPWLIIKYRKRNNEYFFKNLLNKN